MKKLILITIIAILLSSCGDMNKTLAGFKGYSEVTIDGVVYLQFPSGVTVKYNRDGTIAIK